MRRLFLTLASIAIATPAFACINDVEVKNHEREFRSQYRESGYTPPDMENNQASNKTPMYIGGVGAALAAAGSLMVFKRRSPSA